MAGVLFTLAVLAFWLYSLFDVITTPEDEVRNVPKTLWVLVIILVPVVGGLLWFLLGRPARGGAGEPMGGPQRPFQPRPAPPKGPEDDPEFLRNLDRRMRDEE
ncbi:PLDc N-terminal domain-containing protein [Nonomuraea typhae]|uniref:PLDc N-terminal domain-containing protein n=1 Tax=Nonomuraea typhae TaxID=2603600 RepID=A0ABW7Z238_9ACTN|nr:PLDc N-terminal domain-containing protein [Nonomuraea typhae]